MNRTADFGFTIIVPVYNEAENMPALARRLADYVQRSSQKACVLFVDDGSTDASFEAIRTACVLRDDFFYLKLERNGGLSAALKAGIDATRSEYVGYIDADLQTSPDDFELLLPRIADHELVTGVRTDRKDSWFKNVQSKIANSFRRAMTHDGATDTGCPLKVLRADCAARIPFFNGTHRFLPAMVGFSAQAMFSARIAVQWLMSEKARKVVSPTAFWVLSLCGSLLLCVYGWMRSDFSIVFGQSVSYNVYLWNLNAKGLWQRTAPPVRLALMAVPPVVALCAVRDVSAFADEFFRNADIPTWLLAWGMAGQTLFTLRFVYQLVYSRRRHESTLPQGFWLISLAGSAVIAAYAIVRCDAVLIVGQSFGMVAYVRNLSIGAATAKT